uniref:Immunoglobulin V-set domain-containing protein n=1 Tax=Neolamprologus brichardi TaxID=32507 RepID=A0A3Q4H8F7_NEOBR
SMKMSRIMAGIKCVVFLMVLILQWTHARGGLNADDVSLPVVADAEVFSGDLNVHSFYNNKDQLKLQSERFRGRTSLFNDQISAGIASLQLTKVEVQDEGRYKCYTSTDRGNQESFINLKIKGKQQYIYIYLFKKFLCFVFCFVLLCFVLFCFVLRDAGVEPARETDPRWKNTEHSNHDSTLPSKITSCLQSRLIMAGIKCVVFLVVLIFQWTHARGGE